MRAAWLAAAVVAVLAVVVLWYLPRQVPSRGTLVVIGAARSPTSLPSQTVYLHASGGGWAEVGTVSGSVPAAPDQRQLVAASMRAGAYDSVRLGDSTQPVSLTIKSGQVEPLLLGIDSGRLLAGAVYSGNDDVNLGLGELSGKFVAMPAFDLVDQKGQKVDNATIAGKDVVIGAFHTNCHEACPLYTALFLQLAKRLPADVMLFEVTTDPYHDGPAALQAYAAHTGASWTFGTGTEEQATRFWRPFGVELAPGDTHTSTLVLIDRHGYVRLVYRGVPKVGHDIPPSLVSTLSGQGLYDLGSGGDGWGAPDVLQALLTITGPENAQQTGGGKAIPFTLSSTDGSRVSLADLAGHPVVINFWASYCPPCKAEMPMLDRALTAHPGARLLLVDEADTSTVARAFLDQVGVHRPALLDSDTKVLRAYGMFALPTTIFVRADGTIDRRQVGQLDPSVLDAELSNLTTQ